MLRAVFKTLLLIYFVLALSCCGRSCSSTLPPQALVIDIAYPIETLDPRYATSATASRVSDLVYSSLFDLDANSLPQPLLAESIKNIDAKTFKVTLKPNLFFHDGSPLKAEDVVYTFAELGSPDVASPHSEKFDYLDKIYQMNEREIIFKLKEFHAPFLTDLCAIGIVSKNACLNRSATCRHEHMGSGPYRVKSWDKGKEMLHLVPFNQWFMGTAKNELIFRVVRDENTRILELLAKKADIVDGEFSPHNLLVLEKEPHLAVIKVAGLGFTYFAINVRGPKPEDKPGSENFLTRSALANKTVRKALAHAIDFNHIIEKIFLGTADRTSGMLPNNHWAKDQALKPHDYDPKKAQALLDAAGYPRKKDGMRFKITITTTPNRLRQSVAQLYTSFLREVGIDARLRVKDWSAVYQDMKQGNFEIFSAIWTPVTEPDLYHFVHHSRSIPRNNQGGGNRHGYKNDEVDSLIDLGRVTLDKNRRKELYGKIERILLEDLPYIPLWHEQRIVVINKDRVKNYIPSSTGSFLGLKDIILENSFSKAEP